MGEYTIRVHIKYLPPFSRIVGKKTEVFDIADGATASELIKKIANAYASEFLKSNTDLESPRVVKILNGKMLGIKGKDKDPGLKNNDKITIFSAIAGG